MDPQDAKYSHERETASFCSRLNTNPPRLEADRRSKSKQSTENSSEIDAISGMSWEVMNVTFCHSSCQRSAALWWTLLSLDQSSVAVAGVTNSVNARQSEAATVSLFFLRPHPTLLTPQPLPKGVLQSPQFRPHQEINWLFSRHASKLKVIPLK